MDRPYDESRRQTDVWRKLESMSTLSTMPRHKTVAPGAAYDPRQADMQQAILRGAIWVGRIDLYKAGPGPDYTYNVWDYPHWDRLEVHEWLAREAGGDA